MTTETGGVDMGLIVCKAEDSTDALHGNVASREGPLVLGSKQSQPDTFC